MGNTILAIDDSPELLLSLGSALEPEYEVYVATSGEEGLRLAEEVRPTLILLDIMMPGLDGFQTYDALAKHEALRNIPVIFLTSLNKPEDEARCFETGGVDFISKPFSPVVLRARVNTHVRLKQQTDQLNHLALRDGLTGLFNRREFDERFERECRASQRTNTPLSLLMIDIDYFKGFNDSQGHQQGDECLQRVAAVIEQSMQRGRDLAARYGGEEFICLLPETDQEGAAAVAEKVRVAVERLAIPHKDGGREGVVTISVGVATAALCAGNGSELLRRADASLYKAKAEGRNRVVSDS